MRIYKNKKFSSFNSSPFFIFLFLNSFLKEGSL
jgi:hypothetical protein